MSFVVLANSTRVILPLRTRLETPTRLPVLAGILVSQAKSSGHCMQSFIEMGAPGLPRPFRGERWCYEWRNDSAGAGEGDGVEMLACWLGFPNVFFSGGIDPNLRVAVEALGRFGGGPGMLRSLSRISVNIKSGQLVPAPGDAVWMPDDSPKPFPA